MIPRNWQESNASAIIDALAAEAGIDIGLGSLSQAAANAPPVVTFVLTKGRTVPPERQPPDGHACKQMNLSFEVFVRGADVKAALELWAKVLVASSTLFTESGISTDTEIVPFAEKAGDRGYAFTAKGVVMRIPVYDVVWKTGHITSHTSSGTVLDADGHNPEQIP